MRNVHSISLKYSNDFFMAASKWINRMIIANLNILVLY